MKKREINRIAKYVWKFNDFSFFPAYLSKANKDAIMEAIMEIMLRDGLIERGDRNHLLINKEGLGALIRVQEEMNALMEFDEDDEVYKQ